MAQLQTQPWRRRCKHGLLLICLGVKLLPTLMAAGFVGPNLSQVRRAKALAVHMAAEDMSRENAQGLFRSLFAQDSRPIVLYDGVCNMCNGAVNVAVQSDSDSRLLRFAALQSDVGRGLLVFCGREAEDLSSMVVVQSDGKCLLKSEAALFVGRQLDGAPFLQSLSEVACKVLPRGLRDAAYGVVAENRYNFLGKRKELRVGEAGKEDWFLGKAPAS